MDAKMVSNDYRPYIFVLIPFDSVFNNIYFYGIKPVCLKLDIEVNRLDQPTHSEDMMQRLYNEIRSADIIIAEVTEHNPNVYYEVGYAHAIDKKILLLTYKPDNIPFNLKHYQHLVYDGTIESLTPKLEKRLVDLVNQVQEEVEITPQPSLKEDKEFIALLEEFIDSRIEAKKVGTSEIKFSIQDNKMKEEKYYKNNRSNLLTVTLRSTGDKERDILRMRRIYGLLISEPGNDKFAMYVIERNTGSRLEFPTDTTTINKEIIKKLEALVGRENVRVDPLINKFSGDI